MEKIVGTLSVQTGLNGAITIPAEIPCEEYEGTYEFTPSDETQTVEIAQKKATADIIINPIPGNYGLITWNGSFLTVS